MTTHSCSVSTCGRPATWLVKFLTGATYRYCTWHATRNRGQLVWHQRDVLHAEETTR